MRTAYLLGLPLAAMSLGCPAHVQSPPVAAIPTEALGPAVDALAVQVAPAAQRIAPIFESASQEDDGHTDWNIPLQAGQCYLFSGVGGAGVQKLFLYLWNPGEHRVATEKPDRPEVTLRHCPTESGLFHLQAKTGEGHGPFAVGAYVDPSTPGVVPPQVVAAPPPVAPPPPPTIDLGTVIDNQASAVAPGAARQGNFFTASTAQGDRTDWAPLLEAGRCYWFIGAGDPGVRELYLYLWDPSGHRITENRARSNQAVIGHCANATGIYKVQAKVASGKGTYQLGIYVR